MRQSATAQSLTVEPASAADIPFIISPTSKDVLPKSRDGYGGDTQIPYEKSSKSIGTEKPTLTRSITTIVLNPLMSGFS